MNSYDVRHTRKYLKHLCEELIYGVKVGRINVLIRSEGLNKLKEYKESSFKKSLDISHEKRTDLDLALGWVVSTYINFLENKGTGDLVPILSLAESTLKDKKNPHLFRWEEMKDSETVYIIRKNGFISSSSTKIKFKY